MTKTVCLITSTLGLFALSICRLPLAAQVDSPKMTFHNPLRFAVSPPLRELANLPGPSRYQLNGEEPPWGVDFHPGRVLRPSVDPVEQGSPGGPSGISLGLNLAGLNESDCNCYQGRPDTNAAVGDTQVVEWVNVEYAIYDKNTGAQELGPVPGNQLWQNLGGPCYDNNDGDIIVQWDKVNHRWLLAQNDFNFPGYQPPYYACVAISTSADAAGTYYVYQFPLGSDFPDYPKWGIWSNAYYQTQNNLSNTPGAYVCAYDTAKLIVGDPTAEQICFQLTANDYSLLPADVDSPVPPPANQDEFFIGSYDVDETNNHVYIYSMHPDFANPGRSTFTGSGLADPITVPAYSPFCPSPLQAYCIPQEGTVTKLASLGDRLMYRLSYWDDGVSSYVGPTAGRIPAQHWYVNHVTTASSGQAGVRWYEFRAPVRAVTMSAVSLYQSGTFAPDSNYRWMGSIAQDKAGDIALGYSISNTTMWDSIAAAGRVPGDPLGQMEAETLLVAGSGSEGGLGGWGDYSSMAIDADGCTFWYAQEYFTTPATADWQTRLISFRFTGCH